MSINVGDRIVKTYWLKPNMVPELIVFFRTGEIDGEPVMDIDPETGDEIPFGNIRSWLQRHNGNPDTTEFFIGGVPGLLALLIAVIDLVDNVPDGPDWANIPRFIEFLEGNPPLDDLEVPFALEEF